MGPRNRRAFGWAAAELSADGRRRPAGTAIEDFNELPICWTPPLCWQAFSTREEREGVTSAHLTGLLVRLRFDTDDDARSGELQVALEMEVLELVG